MHRIALALLVLAACGHVDVRMPPASTPAERQSAYEQLKPVAAGVTVERASGTIHSTDRLVLARGESVRHAEDLIPVVEADSPTARQARRAQSRGRWKWGTAAAMVAVATTGVVWTLAAISAPDEGEDINDTAVYFGIGLSAGAAVAGSIAVVILERAENDARAAAFATYEASLRKRLDLCMNGLQVVPCEGAGAPLAPAGTGTSGP